MGVTLQVVNHAATEWTQSKVANAEELFEKTCPKLYRRSKRVIQSSFSEPQFNESHVSSSKNGFVWAAYHAYSGHHHLVIRPDDVWFAILTQLSFFINRHAEELRQFFVAHEGKEHIELEVGYLDFELVATVMADAIAKRVVDPELRDWVLPAFSTTRQVDKVVGAILFMGAMQKYFSYGVTTTCGIPSVTLLGEIDDWKNILERIDKIELLGEEAGLFARMLRPVVKHFIRSFEEPESVQVVEFWNTIVHRHSRGSGSAYFTGWLTAFCFWNEEGEAKYLSENHLMFGDIQFPAVSVDKVPPGYASVPIRVTDNGDQYMATMVAGSVGIAATEGPDLTVEADEQSNDAPGRQPTRLQALNTVYSLSGWWVCESEDPSAATGRETEMARLNEELKQLPMIEVDEHGNRIPRVEGKRYKLLNRLWELRAF